MPHNSKVPNFWLKNCTISKQDVLQYLLLMYSVNHRLFINQ